MPLPPSDPFGDKKTSLELRQIRYFVAIYETGSVTKASARLFVAQSALSQQLAHLEAELGVQLFARTAQGVHPTAQGRRFYQHALALLDLLGRAVESVRQLDGEPSGIVKLGMPESVSVTLGLPLLEAVRRELTQVGLQLVEEPSSDLKERLHDGRIDLAILIDTQLDGLAARALIDERLHLVSSRRDRAPAAVVTLADALAHPLVLPDRRDGLRRVIEKAARAAKRPIANLVSEVGSLTVIKNAVAQGVARSILPLSCVADEVERGVLRASPITAPDLTCTVSLYTRKDELLDQAAASVVDLALATAKDLCRLKAWAGGSLSE